MLRVLFLATAVFLLSSCIPVEDFGGYWNKGTIDQAVLGWWHNPADKSNFKTRVMNHAGIYQLDEFDDGWERPENAMQARTLQIGHYSFLMMKVRNGRRWVPFGMYRYKVDGDKMWAYTLNPRKMQGFLAEKYPSNGNIKAAICQGKFVDCVSHVGIGKLDKEVFKILSSIPDTKEFWTLEKDSMSQKMH